jgi:outer membrane protein assembly factor BamD
MKIVFPRILVALAISLLIVGCASQTEQDETRGWSADKLYLEAKSEQSSRNFTRAVKLFETLESRYPYGRYAQQAQLEIAYTHYKDQEPELALVAIDRFIKQNPTHISVDYAYYLKGLINFNESQGMLSSLAQQDMSERDPKAALDSYEAFRQMVTLFPQSRYASDAKLRMGYLIGALANHELHVARYYYRRGAYLAAINRSKTLLQTYSNTKQTEGGLAVMYHSYDQLGLIQLRDDTQRVLLQNFPNTTELNLKVFIAEKPWYKPW